MRVRTFHSAIASLAAAGTLAIALSGCETPLDDQTPPPVLSGSEDLPPGPSPENPSVIDFRSSGDEAFDAWRAGFSSKAILAGRKRETVVSVLSGLQPLEQEVQTASFDNQAEFVKPIWDYSKSAVTPTRIANGQAKLAENSAIFDAIEQAYPPPREILASIWGMETNFGAIIGKIDAPSALATQAAIGRRKDFNEGELIAMMQLIDNGAATRDQFRTASWAGAVGQTQFMPSTFLAHGRDFDNDGRMDLWANTGDALASAANYLGHSGWRKGEPWAIETRLPPNFDFSLGDGRKHTVAAWKALGLSPATAPSFGSDELPAELFLPAGSYGPAFLLFDNFYVIKKYNNADAYALAVGLLADRLAGRPDLARPWPTDTTLLTRQQAMDLQTALNKLGYNAGAVDGAIGRGTRRALQAFQKDKGHVPDGFPTTEMLEKVLAAAA
jgi:membrane-bound lytic murein transglycosylase B